MRTRINCGWLVGHDHGHHTLWRDAELVYDGNTVLFVGERFEGAVEREIDARDKLVAPGFIDTHVHSGHRGDRPAQGQRSEHLALAHDLAGCW
jgi:cytosine/adenosine deaminase-related metal-dependent hydrolase